MSFELRPAIRENVSMLIGLAGASGSGKTFTALRLAQGLSGGKRFAVIDTEARRALHYADQFAFDHGDLRAPFRPSAYADAIRAVDAQGYPVIVVDSCSHEHAGEGGILDWQEEELNRMAGDDWKKREACKMSAWVRPKMDHKRMVQALLQVRAHLILCFRAEEKVEMVRGEDGKWKIVPKTSLAGFSGWLPICEKNLPYELTASFLLTPDRPGVPKPIKLQEQHRPFFPLDQAITEKSGEQLAAWARGGTTRTEKPPTTSEDASTPFPLPPGVVRETLYKRAVAVARRVKFTKGDWSQAWSTYCQGATELNVDPAALGDLLKFLLTRAGESIAAELEAQWAREDAA